MVDLYVRKIDSWKIINAFARHSETTFLAAELCLWCDLFYSAAQFRFESIPPIDALGKQWYFTILSDNYGGDSDYVSPFFTVQKTCWIILMTHVRTPDTINWYWHNFFHRILILRSCLAKNNFRLSKTYSYKWNRTSIPKLYHFFSLWRKFILKSESVEEFRSMFVQKKQKVDRLLTKGFH